MCALRWTQELVREPGNFEGLCEGAWNVSYGKGLVFLGTGGVPRKRMQGIISGPAQDGIKRRPSQLPSASFSARKEESAHATSRGPCGVELCRKLCEHGRITEAVDAVDLLVRRGRRVPDSLFYRLLKRCMTEKDLDLGRRVHALTVLSGYQGHAFLATHLICLYASHSMLEDAMRVFSNVSKPSLYNWAAVISAYAKHGEAARAIQLYRQMRKSANVEPDNRIYSAVLKACATARDLPTCREIHAHILASPGQPGIFVQNGLLDVYAKCNSVVDARSLFDTLPEKDVVTWTTMIGSYAQQGMGQEALSLYNGMKQEGTVQPNCVTFVCLLQACASMGVEALHHGKQLHAQIEQLGLQDHVTLGGSLVNMYVKCGSLLDARSMFDRLSEKNVVTWTAMIAGYAQQGMGEEALSLCTSMQHEGISIPNPVTFICVLQACASVGERALHVGKKLHKQIVEQRLQDNVLLGGSLVNMYAKCGCLEDARSVFDRLPDRNIVVWNTMLAGYVQQGMGQEVLALYSRMQQEGLLPNSVTLVCLLQACSIVGERVLNQGKQLHVQIEEQGLQGDVALGCSLVNMYAKCGSLKDARYLFDRLPQRDIITWTAMIGGYAQQGMGQEALDLYRRMKAEGLSPPDSCTFVCLLHACGIVAGLPLGKQFHAQIKERGMEDDVAVGTALVDMYAKCGSMFDSRQVFDSLPEKSIETWGALLNGYTHQGESEQVFDLLDRMAVDGIQPNGITFLSVLTVCSHMSLLDKGREYFETMRSEYGINPGIEHYTCMMDLVGRAGHVDEALQLARTMPFPADGAVWHTLLGACRKWNNVEIGQQAFELAVRLDGEDAAPYVLMSNIYARAEMWEEAKEMQVSRVRYGAWKEPGQSWWTDMAGVVHSFVVGDKMQWADRHGT